MNASLLKVFVLTAGKYVELEQPWLETVGLGLALWEGEFETQPGTWLRWCDRDGKVIPTGAEGADVAEAQLEQQRRQLVQERISEKATARTTSSHGH